MKKMFTKLLAGVMTVGCVCAMASCGANIDFDKAEDNLEDNDYLVEVVKDPEFMGIEGLVEKSLMAVSEDDVKDYIVIYEAVNAKTAKLYYNVQKNEIKAEIAALEDQIKLYEHILEEYSSELESEMEDGMEDEIEEMQDEIEDLEEQLKCMGVKGKTFWVASSEDVLEDAQGK
jgi:protein subunit release factor A